MKIFISSTLSILCLLLWGLLEPVNAQEFEVVNTKTYTVSSPEEISVTESRRVVNNSANSLISSNNSEVFQIAVISENDDLLEKSFLTAEVFVDGRIRQVAKNATKKDVIEINVPYESALGSGESKIFEIRYTNFGLTKTTGALLDIFAPGFSENFSFTNGNTKFSFETTLKVHNSLGEPNFVAPDNAEVSKSGDFTVYTFPQESLRGTNIWVQIGKSQYYSFALKQNVEASESINKGYFNEYRLVIPRDIVEAEISQNVYFKSFDPEPSEIILDDEKNIIAIFKIPSHEKKTIRVEGYAEVSKKDFVTNQNNTGDITDIDPESMTRYLSPAKYWEVGAFEIQELSTKLLGNTTNLYRIIEKNYSHIVDTIDYSQVKRFGINERQGALKTLQGGAAVCMEYSDLFLTISRTQGIPARAAFGYGYDARLGVDQQDAHQWVQIYIPEQDNWISVDVTWGESGSTLIGGDLNHFYTHVAAIDPDTPSSVSRTSYGNRTELEAPEFEIEAIKSLPSTAFLLSSEDLLSKYPEVTKNQLESYVENLTLIVQTANIPASMSRNAHYMIYTGFALFALSGILILKVAVGHLVRKRNGKTTPLSK